MRLFFPILTVFFTASPVFAASDFLAEAIVKIDSLRSGEVLNRVVADPKAVFEFYQPALDSGSTIVRPVQVTGPADHPVMQVSIRKCVGFICKTVDLDADVTLREGRSGGCDRSFLMVAGLARSSDIVRNVYDRLDIQICFKASADGRGVLDLSASANQAPQYSQGIVQSEMFKMLKLQVAPIVNAIDQVLRAKESF